MVKRALCIGCNYPSKKHGLHGAVNDAFLIADCLQRSCGFQPDDICVLHDMLPGQAKSSERLVELSRRPTRANIVQRLQWLARGARPGDVLFLSFSGYGLQVDDVDGYHDEGLDEAILPTDFADGVGGDFSVIVLSDIHDALMSAPQDCTVTIVMDCDHATSLVDVSGTVDGGLVKGLKLNSTCGFHGHNAKMKQAEHNRAAWLEEPGISVGARPRFQPKMEIANPRKSRVPTRTAMSRSSPRAFCYSAAGHGQTALELQVTDVVDGRETMQQHGALSWSFVHALEDLRCDCTHTQLFAAIEKRVLQVKEKHHYRMDQEVIFTFSKPLAEPSRDKVLRPVPGASLGSQQRGRPSFGSRSSGSGSFPAIVPPPPPGFLGSGASLPSGGDDGEGSRRPPPRAYASFAQPEDRQSQLASAGLQIWRAAWSPQLLEEEEDEEETVAEEDAAAAEALHLASLAAENDPAFGTFRCNIAEARRRLAEVRPVIDLATRLEARLEVQQLAVQAVLDNLTSHRTTCNRSMSLFMQKYQRVQERLDQNLGKVEASMTALLAVPLHPALRTPGRETLADALPRERILRFTAGLQAERARLTQRLENLNKQDSRAQSLCDQAAIKVHQLLQDDAVKLCIAGIRRQHAQVVEEVLPALALRVAHGADSSFVLEEEKRTAGVMESLAKSCREMRDKMDDLRSCWERQLGNFLQRLREVSYIQSKVRGVERQAALLEEEINVQHNHSQQLNHLQKMPRAYQKALGEVSRRREFRARYVAQCEQSRSTLARMMEDENTRRRGFAHRYGYHLPADLVRALGAGEGSMVPPIVVEVPEFDTQLPDLGSVSSAGQAATGTSTSAEASACAAQRGHASSASHTETAAHCTADAARHCTGAKHAASHATAAAHCGVATRCRLSLGLRLQTGSRGGKGAPCAGRSGTTAEGCEASGAACREARRSSAKRSHGGVRGRLTKCIETHGRRRGRSKSGSRADT
mmetsp:Transcript_143130/g.363278  ORF Transcript_143130/g.363278 Transcript_143130/m.363278 type:complete len:978 (-) Transcript_143130:1442-4375(-)